MNEKNERATPLAAVKARLEAVEKGQDVGPAATAEALQELVALSTEADAEHDLEAAQAAGLLYLYRSVALSDPDAQAHCIVQALALLRVVYRSGRRIIPTPLVEIFRENQGLLAPVWHEALASDAGRMARSHDLFPLSPAVAMQRKALDMLPPDSPLRLDYSCNLGVFLRSRHESTSSAQDLAEALDIARTCLAHPDSTGPKRTPMLLNLSLAYRDLHDVDEWLRYARAALDNAGPPGPNRTVMLDNLIHALRVKHRDVPDGALDEIIDASRAELALAGSPPAAAMVVNLVAALITRYEFRGAPQDLDEAIPLLRRYVDAADPADGELPGCLSNLAVALMMRYDATGAASDLEEGLAACRQAVRRARPDDPERAMYNSNLCLLAVTHAGRNQWNDADLRLAIAAGRAALEATPEGHPQYAMYASNLATALLAGRGGDLDEALALAAKAAAAGQEREFAGLYRVNVGYAAQRRYESNGSAADLDDAIARYREALPALPAEMPARADALLALGRALLARHGAGDLEASITSSREAARCATASLSTRLAAAACLAEAAEMRADWQFAADAWSEAIDLLAHVTTGGLSRPDQEYALARGAGLSSRAVAARLQFGDTGGAVEAFERSRAVLLARQLEDRAELRALAKVDAVLAQEYQDARKRLLALEDEQPSALLDPRTGGAALSRRAAAVGRERAALLERLDSLLATIRAHVGFERFCSPAAVPSASAAPPEYPIVLLSVSPVRSDALILAGGAVQVVP